MSDTKNRASTLRFCLGWAAIACAVSVASLQSPGASPSIIDVPQSAETPGGAQAFPVWAQNLEGEIAGLIQRRPDATGEVASILELQIDLRILTRQILLQAGKTKPDDDNAAIVYLRVSQLQAVTAYTDNWAAKRPTGVFMPAQQAALKAIHDLTFKTEGLASPAKLDEACALVGIQLLLATDTPIPGGRLVMMRPVVTTSTTAPSVVTETARSVNDIAATARQLSVSPKLRRELLSLVDAALAEKNPDGPLTKMLGDSVDLARGLQSNTAVEPETRTQIEQNLADGLALYTDERTRSAGQKRLDSLNEYRQLLTHVGRLNLSPDLAVKFGPVFVWARQNPDEGGKVLADIEKFAKVGAAHTRVTPDPALSATYRRALTDLEQQFLNAQAQFINDAGEIGKGGVISAGPAELELSLDAMNEADQLAGILARLPRDLKALAVFRPRPFGGMEKQVNLAIPKLSNLSTPPGQEAAKFIRNVDSLAEVAGELGETSISDVPPAVSAAYAGAGLAKFESRWRTKTSDAATSIAGTGMVDEQQLKSLRSAKVLRLALKEAAGVDAAISKASGLQSWADWGVNAEELTALLGSYQQAMTAAFEGFMSDDDEPMQRFEQLHQHYQPLLKLLGQVAGYAEQLKALPTGFTADAAKLATPLHAQPFKLERAVTYDLWLWMCFNQGSDTDAAKQVFDKMSQRIGRQLGE